MLTAQIVIGGLLLFFGRKLFWLYVAACGFAVGLTMATRMLGVQPEWLALLIGLGAGVLGALVAVFFQPLAIGVGGLLAGGFIAAAIAGGIGLQGDAFFWVAFVLGGVLGAILLVALFDWGLIALSSLLGASLIVPALHLPRTTAFVVWLGLLLLGVAVQAALMRPERKERARDARTIKAGER
jgi:Domain of unknown function (DUF4203)